MESDFSGFAAEFLDFWEWIGAIKTGINVVKKSNFKKVDHCEAMSSVGWSVGGRTSSDFWRAAVLGLAGQLLATIRKLCVILRAISSPHQPERCSTQFSVLWRSTRSLLTPLFRRQSELPVHIPSSVIYTNAACRDGFYGRTQPHERHTGCSGRGKVCSSKPAIERSFRFNFRISGRVCRWD